jgi:hypothetical protein
VHVRLVLVLTVLCMGCAAGNNYEERPFFQQEYDLESHGRKTLFDRLVEFDPGGIKVDIAPQYWRDPPARIAVLPFADEGSANFVVDKIPLTFRSQKERYRWAWTDAQRLRRAMQGYLAQREFLVANLYGVDAVIADHGIENISGLREVSAKDLGDWLGVDAVIYGTVEHYEGYYLALVAGWEIGIKLTMVSTRDGTTLIKASGSRWDVSVLPALDVQDIIINSAQNILQLRDINLARAEEEACREVVKRIPQSNELMQQMAQDAREHAMRSQVVRSFSARSAEPGRTYPVVADPAAEPARP